MIEYDVNLVCALDFLQTLFNMNYKYRANRVPYETFYLDDLEDVNIEWDYTNMFFEKNVSMQRCVQLGF